MSCTVQLDHVVREAVLGVSFWDSVTGRVAAEGLEVREISSGTYARTTPSNVYVFNHLPGLRTWGDPIVWSSPPGRRLTFAVTDRDRRFIPFRFAAEVPQPLLFVPSCIVGGSPPATGQSIPLFSSPSRPVQPGFAAIRADLWDVLADAPAAGAVLEVLGVNTSPWFGVADWRGRVVVQCPYPEPRWQISSPPPGRAALSQHSSTVVVAVRFSACWTSPPPSECQPPDLCEVLTQPPATLLASESPTSTLGAQHLIFGRELVLRSTGRSELLVLPA
jgi:hypothetical protein